MNLKSRGLKTAALLFVGLLMGCAAIQLTVNFNEVRNTIAALVAASDVEWLYVDEPGYVIVIQGAPRFSASLSEGYLIAQADGADGASANGNGPKRSLEELDLGDMKVTPELVAVLRRQQERSDAVSNAKLDQLVGENLLGLLTILVDDPSEELTDLVEAENADREEVIRIVMEQYGFRTEGEHNTVARMFYEERIRVARLGDWVQTPEGEWARIE